ncbi:MAG: cell division protein FtsL [Hyphomicrobium sp.]|nr:cell division protein FtsL [Hyphomicrobiaceae bacterium]
MRVLNFAAFFLALSSAFLLYSLSYDTRRLEARVQEKEQIARRARSDIAVLKAEKGHLSRPERIDPYARALGLVPPRADQVSPSARASLGNEIGESR